MEIERPEPILEDYQNFFLENKNFLSALLNYTHLRVINEKNKVIEGLQKKE